MKKYELVTDSFIEVFGKKLFRIKATVAFGGVENGEMGGYIENEKNLDQSGDAWVSGDARVYGDAQVYGNARVYGNAQVSDHARVYGDAWVSGDAQVYDNAWVSGDAQVYDNARVYGNAWVSGDARVSGYAQVSDHARVYGDAWVSGDARVYGYAGVSFGFLMEDIFKFFRLYISCSLNVYPNPVTKTYLLFKRVNKVKDGEYASCYDPNFIYKDGEKISVEDAYPDKTLSCGPGIHVSTPYYWTEGNCLIAVEVHEDDIITCQEGKLRCKKVKVLGEIE